MEAGHGTQSASRIFDRRRCLENLEQTRNSCQAFKGNAASQRMTSLMVRPFGGRSARMEDLKVIALLDLVLDHVHRGRVLYGRLSAKPVKVAAVHTVLEDEFGNAVRLCIYNAVRATASLEEVEAQFPIGLKLAIKEPNLHWSGPDYSPVVGVDNPADIVRITDDEDSDEGPDRDESEVLKSLEAIRREGNRLFGKEDWIGAVAKYSECIDGAVRKGKSKGKNLEGRSTENLHNMMKLTYSNRAEALLRVRNFEGALSDAEKALELDPTHAKSLVRQGRAAMEVGLYDKACEGFEAALEQRPDERSIVENLMSCMICLEQSRTGYYGTNSSHLSGSTGNYADYIGPVEIRRVNYGSNGRRGLFAKQPVKAGSILLVSNPIAVAPEHPCEFSGTPTVGEDDDIIVLLLQRAAESKRILAQLYSLAAAGTYEMDVPSMELFKPGSGWVPPSASALEVDVDHIIEIAKLNLFNKVSDSCCASLRNGKDGKDQPTDSVSPALYTLPSFLNHSCAPNCISESIGNIKFIRATRDIGLDEELTMRYSGILFTGLEDRQVRGQKLRFHCRCNRCYLEESLQRVFSQISTDVGVLVPVSKDEFAHGRGKEFDGRADTPATRELANVADNIEVFIGSIGTEIPKHQQGWFRACFLEAYLAKYQLEMIHKSYGRIQTLNVILDSMILIGAPGATLIIAQLLLHEVKRRHGRKSKLFEYLKEHLLQVIRLFFSHETDEKIRIWSALYSACPKYDYSMHYVNDFFFCELLNP